MSTEQTAQRENQIRSKPSLEAARAQYEGAMRQMADSIIALVPGLTWNFEENSWNGCGSEYPIFAQNRFTS
ncbi:putative conserved lipoprotein LppV [Mycobacterium xenopi 4042]|uniref:Putative conserved lipoprotein LppV n=1 Tax=Mycobacterium xenopi 4042 TaxID=1299334 RepID=X8ANU1_MYCXE|nr:putative conserved lipoprotein LppV [Mycobacterium xenopi 4042]